MAGLVTNGRFGVPEGLEGPERVGGAYLDQRPFDHLTEQAQRVPTIARCMRTLEHLVFDKEPRLSRGERQNDREYSERYETSLQRKQQGEDRDFAAFYQTRLRQLAVSALRAIHTGGLVPLRFIREDPESDAEVYSHAVVPRTNYRIWRYYDQNRSVYVYVLLRPKAARLGMDEWEVDPDGVVLSGFGYDPNPSGQPTSAVALTLHTAVSDATLERCMLDAQKQLAYPILMLQTRPQASGSSSIDTDTQQIAIGLGHATYTDQELVARNRRAREQVDALDIKVGRLLAARDHQLRHSLPVTSLEDPPAAILDPCAADVPKGAVPLPADMQPAPFTQAQTVAQFTEIRHDFRSLIAASFGIPLSYLETAEHRSARGNYEGERQVIESTVRELRDHVARVLTTVYRRLRGEAEASRFLARLEKEDRWEVLSEQEVIMRAQENAPVVEFVSDTTATFEDLRLMLETGVIEEKAYRELVGNMFRVPQDLISRKRPGPDAGGATAAAAKRPRPEEPDGGD